MRTMRKICRKRMLRRAEVAKMFPWVPAAMTAREAIKTMKSEAQEEKGKRGQLTICDLSSSLMDALPGHQFLGCKAKKPTFKEEL